MSHKFSLFTAASLLALSYSGIAQAEAVFNRIASFPVNLNLPADADAKTATSAEIIAASEDGMTLIYSDSPGKSVGFIDIKDPANPLAAGVVKFDGEPTSVAIAGNQILVALNTSKSKTEPSGGLLGIDLSSKQVGASCDVSGQPDSVVVSPDGTIVAVAVENERDEDVNDGEIPQMPAGHVVIFKLKNGIADCSSRILVDVKGLAAVAGDDPEPEYLDINSKNEIAVTLQENNHIVLINGNDGKIMSHFSAGTVNLTGIDTKSDGVLSFTGEKKDVVREPDTVQWLDDNRMLVANEGDYKGGSRGFTIFSKAGEVLHESGTDLEHRAAMIGHYPDKRRSKGIEPEGAEFKKFGETNYMFVLAERASLVAVYKDTGAAPEFKQLLPTGLGPEGIIAIPSRNLIAVANEVDLIADGGVRSHVTLYNLAEGTPAYPTIESGKDDKGAPIGWGALSGLTADPAKAGILYAVSDSFYFGNPTIYTIDANVKPAKITNAMTVTRGGQPAQMLDLEGIVADGEGGFWLSSEGRSDTMVPHGILHVNDKGEIDKSFGIPEALNNGSTRYGFEGITAIGSGDDLTLWMATQREWGGDAKGFVKLVSYNPKSKEWGAVSYPLEKVENGWSGLSEITLHGDSVYIIERDNQIGAAAKLKKIFKVAVSDLKPGKLDQPLSIVKKVEVRDFIPDFKSYGGYVLDKIESFTIDSAGMGFAVTDNDGVDNTNGETLFWSTGKM